MGLTGIDSLRFHLARDCSRPIFDLLRGLFTLGARSYNSPYGAWAITEDLDDLTSPKTVGYQQVRDARPVNTAAFGVFA